MTTPSSGHGAAPLGPHDDATGRERPAWLIPLLAALAALLVGLLLWLLLRDDGDDDALEPAADASPSVSASELPSESPEPSESVTSSPATQPSATSSAPAAAPTAAGENDEVDLTAGGERVFPLSSPNQDLSTFSGEAVGRSVPVESVPADEGFWLGTGPDQRVWVEIVAIEGETPFRVRAGETVSFTGAQFVPHDESYAPRIGVSAEEGAEQLTAQKAHIQVRSADLRAS